MPTRPPILRRGDTVGIVTLGSPQDSKIISERVTALENMGFNVILGEHVYEYSGIVAGTSEQRASDLMSMFMNKNVKMILPTRGGTGVEGILPFLDFNVIKSNAKIVTGYSDITILLNVLYQYADLITFHSLLLIDFRTDTPPYNFNQFYAATSAVSPTRLIQNPPEMKQKSKVKGNITGRIVGGNLTSFVGTLGTPYEIDTRGKIIFLEETHEPSNIVYRYLTHLKLAGKFDDCAGIVMGECTGCQVSYGQSYKSVIDEILSPLGKPLMTNVATGHGTYKAAIPIGALANLNTINNTFTILEPTVRI
jgi:muramoyltetrapeptide carboxypeptidase